MCEQICMHNSENTSVTQKLLFLKEMDIKDITDSRRKVGSNATTWGFWTEVNATNDLLPGFLHDSTGTKPLWPYFKDTNPDIPYNRRSSLESSLDKDRHNFFELQSCWGRIILLQDTTQRLGSYAKKKKTRAITCQNSRDPSCDMLSSPLAVQQVDIEGYGHGSRCSTTQRYS
jgi:hypothetical protein